MKFIDEAVIDVEAGAGGDGCLSFHRAKNVPRGGPDGGDGGDGGDVVLIANDALNTLVDFRFMPRYRARSGEAGKGNQRTGAKGETLTLRVPSGTTIIDDETLYVVGDVKREGDVVTVARGGRHGLGNTHFKSSTNRAPRQTTKGTPGDKRRLRLQLKVIADVGLLGLPNAGKSTLISRVSASHPKIADYPFTTLTPNLGVVRVAEGASFVMADIPGLIEGAAEGAGLGVRFLRHLSRTRLLLHLVDVHPLDGSNPVDSVRIIERELSQYSAALAEREIWLLATKTDLAPGEEDAAAMLREAFPGRRVLAISAVTGAGVDDLVQALMRHVQEYRRRMDEDPEFQNADEHLLRRIGDDVLRHAVAGKPGAQDEDDDDSFDDDDDMVEVVYRRD